MSATNGSLANISTLCPYVWDVGERNISAFCCAAKDNQTDTFYLDFGYDTTLAAVICSVVAILLWVFSVLFYLTCKYGCCFCCENQVADQSTAATAQHGLALAPLWLLLLCSLVVTHSYFFSSIKRGGSAKSAALHLMPDLLHLYGMCCTVVILTFYYDQHLEPVPGIDQYMKPFWPLLLADLLGITGVMLRLCSHCCSTPNRPAVPGAAVPLRFGQLQGIAGSPPYQMHLVGEGDPHARRTSAARTSVTAKGPVCDYQLACLRFKKSLGIPESYFSHEQDKCFCETCHKARGDDDYYTRGEPEKKYAVPVGWTRFGLSLNPSFKDSELNVFDNWHRAYHGTDPDVVKKILQNSSQLLMAGDVALGGRKLGERDGHFNPKRKPEGFDTAQLFVTPSIVYAGDDAYASPKKFEDDGKVYGARVAFQLCIRPDSYEVGPETIGARREGRTIDPLFSNDELEWSTKERGGTALYGLLVKLETFVEGQADDRVDIDELLAELRFLKMLYLLGALGSEGDDD
ncbi:NEURL4 [Branchiostoma lanceolatum]|uniref:NEURL4 protein n=1 Tax=Branchiostoma lanceolatum TaxID=7740 RepID=A0A8J9ZCN5_BRALA|nr:NEURL4 [Branchiostoma lanceolatum]